MSVVRLWILSMATFVTPYACALGMGEIQVNSNLGEPLKAQISLIEATAVELRELKAHLASAEEYKKIGLQFPAGIKFAFQVINEQSSLPFISITTARPINELFVDLLIEVSLPSSKTSKSYTFLLNPAPDSPALPITAEPPTTVQPTTQAEIRPQDAVNMPAKIPGIKIPDIQPPDIRPAPANVAVVDKPVIAETSHNISLNPNPGHPAIAKQRNETAVQSSKGLGAKNRNNQRFGKLSMSLSMSLSISKSEPGNNIKQSNDTLQEELIAKEKTLNELKAQIAEMQGLIRALQARLIGPANQAASAVADTAVLAASSVAAVSDESNKPKVIAPVIQRPAEKPDAPVKSFMPAWAAAALGLLLVGVPGLLWYLKRKPVQKSGLFDGLHEVPEQPTAIQPTAATPANFPGGVPVIKTPKYTKDKSDPAEPEEYELLEEADICLRFGHDKQAEEVVHEAIKINPDNPQSYLILLQIYVLRENKVAFLSVARHIAAMGDKDAWQKAVEMGRKLDPNNPLYAEFSDDADDTMRLR